MQLVAGPITNAGLEVERLARVPYLCLGDVKGSRVYELDDAVLVPSLSLPLSLSFLSPLFLSLAVSLSASCITMPAPHTGQQGGFHIPAPSTVTDENTA
jgi:hypothetical protein